MTLMSFKQAIVRSHFVMFLSSRLLVFLLFKNFTECLRVSISVTKHHDQKASRGGKGVCGLHFFHH